MSVLRRFVFFSLVSVACDRRREPAPPAAVEQLPESAAAPAPAGTRSPSASSTGATVKPPTAVAKAKPGVAGVPGGGPDPLTLDGNLSTSIGSPNDGSLRGGVPLPLSGPGYRFDPRKKIERRHGTVELVAALVRAATTVHREMPGNTLTLGDISLTEGGEIAGHGSHRAGRDADVMFYLLHADGSPADGIPVPIDPAGEGTDYNDLLDPSDDVPLRIDVPRTWAFVAALLADDTVAVQQIFIVEHLRAMLLAQGKKVDAPAEVIERFSDITCQPRFPHDDHMHIRVFCSAEDIGLGCRDVAPIYPWQRKRLAEHGVKPVAPDRPARGKKRRALKSTAQARAQAGEMDASVVKFLDRREAWAKRPHPGRRWCK